MAINSTVVEAKEAMQREIRKSRGDEFLSDDLEGGQASFPLFRM